MKRAPFEPVGRLAVESFDAGEAAETWSAGDILLTHGDALISRLIRFGERLRIHGDDRAYCWFNHAALVLNDQGDLAEALSQGVVRTNASKYLPNAYAVVRPGITAADTKEVLAFADWVLATHDRYGWFTIASIAVSVLTGSKFTFFVEHVHLLGVRRSSDGAHRRDLQPRPGPHHPGGPREVLRRPASGAGR
jgi:hypothetical protein